MVKKDLDVESLRITWRDKGYCSCHHIPLKEDKCAVQWLKKQLVYTEDYCDDCQVNHIHFNLVLDKIDEAFEDVIG